MKRNPIYSGMGSYLARGAAPAAPELGAAIAVNLGWGSPLLWGLLLAVAYITYSRRRALR